MLGKKGRVLRQALWAKQNGRCFFCDCYTFISAKQTPHQATIEHLESVFKYGDQRDDSKTVMACYKCNQDRNTKEHLTVPLSERPGTYEYELKKMRNNLGREV
jgi:hypothetical protein